MKVNFDLRNNRRNVNQQIKFEGYTPFKDSYGARIYEFNYPYDSTKYDCYLEVCSVIPNSNGKYSIVSGMDCQTTSDGYLKLKPEGNKVDMCEEFNIREGEPFAYHYVLIEKGKNRSDSTAIPTYKIDAGDVIDETATKGNHEIYNIVTQKGPYTYDQGAMKLIIPDSYNPMWKYNKSGKIEKNPNYDNLNNVVRTFANKFGGNLAGIEKDVKDGKFDEYNRLISLPFFTDDTVSSHGYWNKNCMQMIQSLGSINNYASLQRELFKKGINFVSDGAYVNEGLEGIHLAHVYKYGTKSPFSSWFRAENLKNGPLTLGVFSRNNDYVTHKLVNPKYIYTQDNTTGKIKISANKAYNKQRPTYFQIYDKRLVSEALQKDLTKRIDTYDILNTDNLMEINDTNDTIIPYAFEIDPELFNKNIERLNEFNAKMRSKNPQNLQDAFDYASDLVFSKTSDPTRYNRAKNAFANAVSKIELAGEKLNYPEKVNKILNSAKEDFGLNITDAEKTQMAENLSKMRNIVRMKSYMGTRILGKFATFELAEKQVESKIDTWNANTDIPKLKYISSKADLERIKLSYDISDQAEVMAKEEQSNYSVQDYAIMSGKYWTKKTADILKLYVAQQLPAIDARNPQRTYDFIASRIQRGDLPKKLAPVLNSEVVRNVLNNEYDLPTKLPTLEYKDILLKGLMNLPPDAIEFGDNLCATLSTPYITKRATQEDQLGLSRFDMYKLRNPHIMEEYAPVYRQVDRIYTHEMSDFASEVIDNLNAQLPDDVIIYKGFNATPYGKYVLPMLTEQIAKFAFIKALAPQVKVSVDRNGEISYDYEALKNVTLQTLGVYASSPEDEATQVVEKLKAGIKKISKEDKKILVSALFNSIKGTNENSFKLADVIVDRINAGLDWRIDAAKDIGDINALLNKDESLDVVWPKVTKFWKHFTDGVYDENRNSYIVAEITNDWDMHVAGGKGTGKYPNEHAIVNKFLRDSSMTSFANYTYYYSSILNLFARHFDNFDKTVKRSDFNVYSLAGDHIVYDRINNKSKAFFRERDYNTIMNAYNFIGNHDKPRVLHGLILNTDWYNIDFSDKNNAGYRERAIRILDAKFIGPILERGEKESDAIYKNRVDAYLKSKRLDGASKKALAMADALEVAFKKSMDEKFRGDDKKEKLTKVAGAVYKSIGDLANGRFKGRTFAADGFGIKPVDVAIDMILEQAQFQHGLNLTREELEALKNKTLEIVLAPALKKYQAMMEVLVLMPGIPTLYAGDEVGATGYESSSKNMYLQNRGYIHNEWLDPNKKEFKFIQDHKAKMDNIMKIRSRKELHALNDGAPYVIDPQFGQADGKTIGVSGLLRQGTDGSIVLSLFNISGINHSFDGDYKPKTIELKQINLDSKDNKNARGLSKGLTQGTVLYNAADENDQYVVREYNGQFFIKRNRSEHKEPNADENVYITDTTLTLYAKAPESQKQGTQGNPTFTGLSYKNYCRIKKGLPQVGSQLSLVAR